ncbi:DUF3313 domain-containing protein [Endozoicomonas sp. Mp262]|uniref:DUF3313 domain-containing protein n=1 Tax=Endozoicomonas sp. Mp262 TaxID=2919499 RepID=UPI0021D990AF
MRQLCIPFLLVALTGCVSRLYIADDYSGFLKNYSRLEKVETPSESDVWRWISPDIKSRHYKAVYFEPLIFFPQPHTQDQVSREALETIRQAMEAKVLDVANHLGLPRARQKGAGVLVIKPAITSLSVKLQDLQIREIIPVRLVISGAELAMGWRDKDVTFLLESELQDGQTGQTMAMSVRKIKTLPLQDDKQKLSIEHARSEINQLGKDLKIDFANLKALIEEKRSSQAVPR